LKGAGLPEKAVLGFRPEALRFSGTGSGHQVNEPRMDTDEHGRGGCGDGEGCAGVQPEIRNPKSEIVLRGTVDMVEPMGAETFVQVALDRGARFTARGQEEWRGEPGTRAEFALDVRHAHFFDAETGAALLNV
jgi:ABC-type sugar transport system ATPase subunit